MNYPVWYLPEIGGGTLIALIAITHVFVSHFAVGGGLYLVIAERKGLRANDQRILEFTRCHARFFLLMTAVLGALTGVGIWFIISLVNPTAVSFLIHNFLFAWASEWVMFGVESIAIFVYYYTFGRMDPKTHQAIGWIYFVAAWFSLFFINGIICYMLTPAGNQGDLDFWPAFFNPSFIPSLFFRTFVSFMFAGVYAFLTGSFLHDKELKISMLRFSGKWVLLSILCAAPFGYWYLHVIPGEALALVDGASPTIRTSLQFGYWATAALIVSTLLLFLRRPSIPSLPVSIAVFVSAFLFMGSFEWTREAARRPYAINGLIYSSGLRQADISLFSEDGFLRHANWAATREAKDDKDMGAGRELFKFQCYACHTAGGFNNDIVVRTKGMSYETLENYIGNLHRIRYFMPPFAGNEKERGSLAAFIIKGLQGRVIEMEEAGGGADNDGESLFREHCTVCHPESLVRERTAGWDYAKVRSALDHLNALQPAMPDFNGSPPEKDLIAKYIRSMNESSEGDDERRNRSDEGRQR